MSITIDVHSAKDASEECQLHLLPCRIEHTGPAAVEQYFCSAIQTTENNGMTASYRGRPLDGHVVEVPSGYTGRVLQEPRQTFHEDDDRRLKVTHKFKKFTYWNLDMKPSENDKLQKALQWIDLSQEVHRRVPITKEGKENASENNS